MFIAHIPASYLLAKVTTRRRLSNLHLLALSIGSIFPDIDLLRFYLLDNHQYHHHSYWTHRPIIWVTLFIVSFGLAFAANTKGKLAIYLFFMANLLHMALDTIVGEIAWLWPFTNQTWTPVHILDTHEIWILNFFLHWTFAVELVICILATLIFIKYDGFRVRIYRL